MVGAPVSVLLAAGSDAAFAGLDARLDEERYFNNCALSTSATF